MPKAWSPSVPVTSLRSRSVRVSLFGEALVLSNALPIVKGLTVWMTSLKTCWPALSLSVGEPPVPLSVNTAVSLKPGTVPELQLSGLFQLRSPPLPVHVQVPKIVSLTIAVHVSFVAPLQTL